MTTAARNGRTPVLFLAYYFPPRGGGGVQRSSKFVRHLPEHGYDPIVITGPESVDWVPCDATLRVDIPPKVEVVRVPGPVPMAGRGFRWRAERLLRWPTPFDRWWVDRAVRAGRKHQEAALIHASLSPYSGALAARALSRELGRPWVVDLRDPWALSEVEAYPTLVHRRLELRTMRALLGAAAAIVVTGDEVRRRLLHKFPEFAELRVEVIPNGYDAADFPATPEATMHGAFRIVHTGSFYTVSARRLRARRVRKALGGVQVDADFQTRSPAILLAALRRLTHLRPELRGCLQVHLAGALSPDDEDLVEKSGCRDLVRMHGYLSHAESVRLVSSADVLFLPMETMPPGSRSASLPGKLYEYLASGRPILAAAPEGDARDLLDGDDWAVVCEPDDVKGIADALLTLISAAPERRGRRAERPSLCRFERRFLTGRLGELFDEVLGRPRPLC